MAENYWSGQNHNSPTPASQSLPVWTRVKNNYSWKMEKGKAHFSLTNQIKTKSQYHFSPKEAMERDSWGFRLRFKLREGRWGIQILFLWWCLWLGKNVCKSRWKSSKKHRLRSRQRSRRRRWRRRTKTRATSGIRQWCESLFMYLNMFIYMIIKINYIFNFK